MRFRSVAPQPTYVDTPELVESAHRRCKKAKLLAVDTETLGLEKDYIKVVDQVVNMGLSPDEESRFFVPRKYLRHFQDLLADPSIPKALHNYKFDHHRLMNAGCEIRGPVWETAVFDFLIDEDLRENRHRLDHCSLDFFGIPMAKYSDIVGNTDPRTIVPGHPQFLKYLDYGTLDAWITRKLALRHAKVLQGIHLFRREMFDDDLEAGLMTSEEVDTVCGRTMWDHYWDYEEPQIKSLFAVERRGIQVDVEHLQHVAEELQKDMEEAAREISRLAGYPLNPNSTKQMGKWLFEDLGFNPLGRTATGAPQVDEATLNHFAAKGVEGCILAVKYKKASKLKGTYALGLLKWVHTDGRIRTSYSPLKVTGRLGSSEPNLQNIPRPNWDVKKIRAAFIPDCEDDILLVVDYGQLEMRVLASLCEGYGDSTMADGIRAGLDMHSFTGAKMLGITYEDFVKQKNAGVESILAVRQAAKAINFGIVYGIAAQGLSVQLTEALGRYVGEGEAQEYINTYFEAFPGVQEYMRQQRSAARNIGYVMTIAGRRRRLSAARSKRPAERSYAYRQAINAPVQGSAADIVKAAMIEIEEDEELAELGYSTRMQVHDEFVGNVKGGAKDPGKVQRCVTRIKTIMERMFQEILTVPLIADPAIVPNWSAAKD